MRQCFLDYTETRNNNLDFLRFWLAAVVILSHSYSFFGVPDPLQRISRDTLHMGDAAVDFFFLISGFLITRSWIGSRGVGDYLKKRVLRIYPAFLVAGLFCALVVGPVGSENAAHYLGAVHWPRFAVDLLTLKFVLWRYGVLFPRFPASIANLNGSLWTIRIEFECYLLVILFGLLHLYRKPLLLLGVLAAVFAGFALLLAPPAWLAHRGGVGDIAAHMHLLLAFVAGMCAFLYRDKIPYSSALCWGCFVLGLAFAWMGWIRLFLFVLGGYPLFFIAFNPKLKLQNWGKNGDFSYGIYLYGWPLQLLVMYWFPNRLSPILLSVLALIFVGRRGVSKLASRGKTVPETEKTSDRSRLLNVL